jgi:hypothetical protein
VVLCRSGLVRVEDARINAPNRVFAATGLRPFAQMAFVTAAAEAPAAPTWPGGPDGHLANTYNVIRETVLSNMNRNITIIFAVLLFVSVCVKSQDLQDYRDAQATAKRYTELKWWEEQRESMIKLGILSGDEDLRELEFTVGESFESYRIDEDYLMSSQETISWDSLVVFSGWQFCILINGQPGLILDTDDWGSSYGYGGGGIYDLYKVKDLYSQADGYKISVITEIRFPRYVWIYSENGEFFITSSELAQEGWENKLINRNEWISELRGRRE